MNSVDTLFQPEGAAPACPMEITYTTRLVPVLCRWERADDGHLVSRWKPALRPCAADVKALVWQDNTNLPAVSWPDQDASPTSQLSDFAEQARRVITVSVAVLIVHCAALKYIFLAS